MVLRKVSALLVGGALLAGALANAQTEAEIDQAIQGFNRGKTFHQERRYEDAVREYRKAVKLDPENPFIFNAMGLALASLGSFRESLESFNRALTINPDLTDVYNNIGMVYAESGERDKAFEAFGRAVRNPNYLTPEKALYNIGSLYFEDGNYELALTFFKRSVEKKPEFVLGYRGLGKVMLAVDDIEGAEIEFKKALDLFDADLESLFQLARIHQQRGDAEQASALYRRVVEVDRLSTYGQLAREQLEALKSGS